MPHNGLNYPCSSVSIVNFEHVIAGWVTANITIPIILSSTEAIYRRFFYRTQILRIKVFINIQSFHES